MENHGKWRPTSKWSLCLFSSLLTLSQSLDFPWWIFRHCFWHRSNSCSSSNHSTNQADEAPLFDSTSISLPETTSQTAASTQSSSSLSPPSSNLIQQTPLYEMPSTKNFSLAKLLQDYYEFQLYLDRFNRNIPKQTKCWPMKKRRLWNKNKIRITLETISNCSDPKRKLQRRFQAEQWL